MDHAAELFSVLSDPAIYEFENQPPRSLEWLRDRYQKLEQRESPDGHEKWLNWAVRLSSGDVIGYVQATIYDDGRTIIAYEFASRYWGRSLAFQSVTEMLKELRENHDVDNVMAILKTANHRSLRLLQRLGFQSVSEGEEKVVELGHDETLMRQQLFQQL